MTSTLGICIPTYKRPDFLRRCVLSALDAAGDRPVRVFIADDSMDETNIALYTELRTRLDAITVHRNPINLGIDDNIQQAVDLCDCDYAWIVGEDDYFLPGSVQRVHDLLQATSNAFIFANYAYVGDDENLGLGLALDVPDGEIAGSEFVARHLWAAGFIGACIVDRRRWGDTDAAPYKGTYYTHVGRICELLARWGDPVRIVAEPCVANRVEGTDTFTWKRDSYGVFFGFKNMCEKVALLHPSVAAATLHAAGGMAERYGWLNLRVAMRLRAEGGYDFSQYRRYLAPTITNSFKRLAFMLISITPPQFFKPIVLAYRRVRHALHS